jgi:hypothetical protein
VFIKNINDISKCQQFCKKTYLPTLKRLSKTRKYKKLGRYYLPYHSMTDDVFAKGVQPAYMREAELKHGRLAMVAALLLPLSEQFSDRLGINFFQENPEFVVSGLSLMVLNEFTSMVYGWEDPLVKPFALKEDYQPGDLKFTIGVTEETMGTQMDKELNNGRLAMIGIFGMIVQELVTHQQLF